MLFGIISDTHIYDRAMELPKIVFDEFSNVDLIIHCGDITDKDVLEWLGDIADVIAVKGNMDYLNLPKQEILDVNDIKIGIIHGDEVFPRGDRLKLRLLGKEMGVDVLISGHTHTPFIDDCKDILLLNPGSPTVPRCNIRSIMKLYLDEKVSAKLIPI
ncbi:phosphodiesterase, MJ0936 family [Methanocaldococcus vulcanius M7]|uniref:Phosphoesterase n=1 Tax=Methanocaldococcus vulcanius (strain ATCC 700851 / DSM 12094 / M7) TaxID=579137 RepID=C9REX8_METVM|nr:metallophosphoesterase [Methanocaldococcus vulcanius]ACX72130.1 phosphodiesterase, MJ0936 family [Methanocaldococcus vulcanius M7]